MSWWWSAAAAAAAAAACCCCCCCSACCCCCCCCCYGIVRFCSRVAGDRPARQGLRDAMRFELILSVTELTGWVALELSHGTADRRKGGEPRATQRPPFHAIQCRVPTVRDRVHCRWRGLPHWRRRRAPQALQRSHEQPRRQEELLLRTAARLCVRLLRAHCERATRPALGHQSPPRRHQPVPQPIHQPIHRPVFQPLGSSAG
jgi:hypothetical protein